MERADGLIRVVYTHYTLTLDKDVGGNLTWKPLLELFAGDNPEAAALLENNTEASIKRLLLDTSNSNSLKVIVTRARENARGVQDHITKEVWEAVNSLYHLVGTKDMENRLMGSGALGTMEQLSHHCVIYTGISDITMPRNGGWYFMNLGKYVERSFETLLLTESQFKLLSNEMVESKDIVNWRYLLLALSGYELHLKTYRSAHYNLNVLHQVLLNEDFPHSLLYSLTRLERHLKSVIKQNRTPENEGLTRFFGRLISRVRYMEPEQLRGQALEEFFVTFRQDLFEFNKQLNQLFFSYA
jgi:uncharacterized alpha-E superfamily protein